MSSYRKHCNNKTFCFTYKKGVVPVTTLNDGTCELITAITKAEALKAFLFGRPSQAAEGLNVHEWFTARKRIPVVSGPYANTRENIDAIIAKNWIGKVVKS